MTDRQTDRLSESQKELVVSLVIKTKVVQNVNRMSDCQKAKKTDEL